MLSICFWSLAPRAFVSCPNSCDSAILFSNFLFQQEEITKKDINMTSQKKRYQNEFKNNIKMTSNFFDRVFFFTSNSKKFFFFPSMDALTEFVECLDSVEEEEKEVNLSQEVKISKISLKEIEEYGKERFNSNNHWGEKGKPDDYDEVIDRSRACHWIPKFHEFYFVLNLQRKDLIWIEEADKIGRQTVQFPKMFEDELEDAVKRYRYVDEILSHEAKGFFVRTDAVSLKEGIHRVGPYFSIKQVLESVVTCRSTHTPIREDDSFLSLYFLPWKTIHTDTEFRVFVKENRITSISQQHLYHVNGILSSLEKEEDVERMVLKWVKTILDAFENSIVRKITHLQNYVMDIAVLDPLSPSPKPYFIEINSFGKEYASGSSLFHWLNDEDQLYGKTQHIEFRYTID